MKYAICPRCGAHLDFNEVCDCIEEELEAAVKVATESSEQSNESDSRTLEARAS